MSLLDLIREYCKKQQEEMRMESVANVDFETHDCCKPPEYDKKEKSDKNNKKEGKQA